MTFCQFSLSPVERSWNTKESRFGYLDDDALTLPLGLFTFFLHLPSLKIQSLKNTAIFTHPFHIYRVNEDTHTHTQEFEFHLYLPLFFERHHKLLPKPSWNLKQHKNKKISHLTKLSNCTHIYIFWSCYLIYFHQIQSLKITASAISISGCNDSGENFLAKK